MLPTPNEQDGVGPAPVEAGEPLGEDPQPPPAAPGGFGRGHEQDDGAEDARPTSGAPRGPGPQTAPGGFGTGDEG